MRPDRNPIRIEDAPLDGWGGLYHCPRCKGYLQARAEGTGLEFRHFSSFVEHPLPCDGRAAEFPRPDDAAGEGVRDGA